MPGDKYVCNVCGYEYEPVKENNTAFDALPADWVCPVCGAAKSEFEPA
jgi:rubredoxin